MILQDELDLKLKWRRVDCVCFDVDSTVCQNEAIDDLAEFVGVADDVKRITNAAMGGNMSFKEALRLRLNIIRPSSKSIDQFNKHQRAQLTSGIQELICLLHQRGVPVYLVSGGFRLLINPIATQLDIPVSNVYANTVFFNECGEYAGFDETELTCESGGKGRVIQLLKETHGYNKLIMVGDGATDLESCPPADGFIGFGGNVVREKGKEDSIWYVMSFKELTEELLAQN